MGGWRDGASPAYVERLEPLDGPLPIVGAQRDQGGAETMSDPVFAQPKGEAGLSKVRQALPGGWRLDRGTHCIFLHNPALGLPMRPVTAEVWRQLENFAERAELELLDLFDDMGAGRGPSAS